MTYIGKTSQGLARRMQGYRTPAAAAERGGSTNIRNNRLIKEALLEGAAVEVFVLRQTDVQHHGGFRINLAAGLEDSLIRELAPPWNGARLADRAASTRPTAAVVKQLPAPVDGVATADLFAFCRDRHGKPFATTARGREFLVEVDGTTLQITPASSGRARPVPESNVAAVLERFHKSGSVRSADYQDLTFHASYVLAVLHAYRQGEGQQ